ncbi:glycosyltransferase family 2 protein [Flavihumibacter sp. CACIAM 22H1]|uniref:glycosyltransferase family 2 protein n=1 Tax=Flavihumibacter sp. CACIAM 22H1 TaxID=1812911 RepID=UPI0007A85A13|nr:glycosyltransferase family 2 protein [Flavihumibacter sp. CACIAM 22H1]KYP16209.1 MAG: hypothetical protein A1D16_14230 [Flavihumibacter sp. CACIAM 22H1]
MEIFCQLIFWISFLILVYTYLGYGLLVFFLAKRKKQLPVAVLPEEELPALTVLIPAYNEAGCIGAKIRNTLELKYPRTLFRVLVITDGSTDGTEQIVKAFPQVELLHGQERLGKAMALNRAMEMVETPIVIVTDANALLNQNALRLLVSGFADPSIGAISGEKQVGGENQDELSAEGEGLYWKYESFLKKNDARLYSVVGAAGELLAFRAALFQPLEPDTILDDFVLSMRICEQGYRIGYEPAAKAFEKGSLSLRDEEKRKIRIAAGGFQALKRLQKSWSWRFNPLLFFQFISHRVSRWVFAAPALLLLGVSTLYLVVKGSGSIYQLAGIIQLLFYSLAVLGWLGARTNTKLPFVYIPYYFVFMHWSIVLGLFRFLTGGQDAKWEKSDRIRVSVKNDQGQ